jgi:hypothetical protein
MKSDIQILPRRASILQICVGCAMIWISAEELLTRPVDYGNGIILDRNYWRIGVFGIWGLSILWSVIDPFEFKRRRTLTWDDDQLIIETKKRKKVIKWNDLEKVREDQIAFHLFPRKAWRGTELLKYGLPVELHSILETTKHKTANK